MQRVLQQRRLDLHREEELALRPPSDLEQELRKRQQKLQEVLTILLPLNVPHHWNGGQEFCQMHGIILSLMN